VGNYWHLSLARLQKRFRGKRARLFCHHLRPSPQDRILDVGGGYGDYFATVVPFRENVWVAEIDERILQRARQHGFQTALISTDGVLPFPDQSFDIVHCNSVIEHVLVPEHRARLASEIQRVGRNWFIQTPNRYFFLEPHTGLPFAQFLPEPLVRVLLRYMRRVWDGDLEWSLLDRREILSLFPGGELVRERFLGLTKSLVVVGGERIACQADARPVARRALPLPAR
jgi:hypothetical protein